jgi:NADH dehydrogenase FAD-containing subunit
VPSLGTGDPASAATQNALSAAAAASALSQGGALAQVVQNTLNNQSIQTFTTLNVSLNTLQVLRQMNLQSTLQSAQLLSFGH